MRDKPLHWSDGSAMTLCGMPTPKRRYIGRWNHNEATLDLALVTCDPCRARLRNRRDLAPVQAKPEPTPFTFHEPTIATILATPEPTKMHAVTEPKPAQLVAVEPSDSKLNLKMLGSLGETIQEYVEGRAREIAQDIAIEAMAKLDTRGPMSVEWTVNHTPFAKIEGSHHKALPEILNRIACGFRNFYIVGPAGCGKTTLGDDVTRSLSARKFAHVSCSAGMSESSVTGRGIPNLTTGKNEFQSTEFIDVYENGGVFLFDEVDAADSNMLVVTHSALANGHMVLPMRSDSPQAIRHPDCVILCAANTFGTGADRQYVGRNQLDAAFLDRFVGCTIEVDYDRDLEAGLVGDAHICAAVWGIRDKVSALKMRRIVSTRFLLSVTRLVKGAGMTLANALKACTIGWTPDELTKAGV